MEAVFENQDGVERSISDAPATCSLHTQNPVIFITYAMLKEKRFHGLKLEWGIDQFLPLNAFDDASNGYLVEDTCVFGVEVFVIKERITGKGECLSLIKDPLSIKHVWKIENFSESDSYYIRECFESKAFVSGDQKCKKCNRSCSFLSYDQELSIDHSFVLRMPDKYDFTSILSVCLHLVLCMGKIHGVVRFISDAPPTHYKLKIQLFSLLVKNAVEKYESAEFEAGGYKWKLVLYPSGNKSKNVKDHISLYLTLADTSSLPLGWEVYAVLRLFLLDQRKDIQEDRCVFGTEVFVTKERGRVKAECLSLIKDTSNAKYVWKIENFSKLDADNYFSEAFSAGGHKWKIQLYPKGLTYPKGTHLSLYLYSVDLTPGSKVYTDYTFRILDQLHAKHVTFKADRCFIDPANVWGWRNFVSLSHLNDPVNGCLVKDVCVVEAEVNVWGCQSSTADIVK
ncbi:hypothetical protein Q3G72_010983 [Acer saccharum]|nr:hypothetical protein Q3G72_010983 [Acer saccharum]